MGPPLMTAMMTSMTCGLTLPIAVTACMALLGCFFLKKSSKSVYDDPKIPSWIGSRVWCLLVLFPLIQRTLPLPLRSKHWPRRYAAAIGWCFLLPNMIQLGPEASYAIRRGSYEGFFSSGPGAQPSAKQNSTWFQTIPVGIVAFDPSRRRHMHHLLHQLGFKNVRDVELVNASYLVPADLVASGQITAGFAKSAKNLAYIANSMQHIRALQNSTDPTQGLLLVEDDLMLNPALAPSQAREQMLAAIESLPRGADALYLEACWETCETLRFGSPITKARRPACSAAIYFTSSGRQRIADACRPAFERIDLMYEWLVRTETITAYISTPVLFFQDAAFGSIMDSEREGDAWIYRTREWRSKHKPRSDVCRPVAEISQDLLFVAALLLATLLACPRCS